MKPRSPPSRSSCPAVPGAAVQAKKTRPAVVHHPAAAAQQQQSMGHGCSTMAVSMQSVTALHGCNFRCVCERGRLRLAIEPGERSTATLALRALRPWHVFPDSGVWFMRDEVYSRHVWPFRGVGSVSTLCHWHVCAYPRPQFLPRVHVRLVNGGRGVRPRLFSRSIRPLRLPTRSLNAQTSIMRAISHCSILLTGRLHRQIAVRRAQPDKSATLA